MTATAPTPSLAASAPDYPTGVVQSAQGYVHAAYAIGLGLLFVMVVIVLWRHWQAEQKLRREAGAELKD